MKRVPYYIVIGRIPFDDEDTLHIVRARSWEQAEKKFLKVMYEQAAKTFTWDKDGMAVGEDGEPAVYINYIVRCATAPKVELCNNY